MAESKIIITKDLMDKVIEELTEYRAIGTIEKLKSLQEDYWKLNEICKFYSEIGTVEEFKSLKEKSVAKKPLCISMAKDKDTNVGSIGRCPCCDYIVAEDMLWCDDCGQKLDWQ